MSEQNVQKSFPFAKYMTTLFFFKINMLYSLHYCRCIEYFLSFYLPFIILDCFMELCQQAAIQQTYEERSVSKNQLAVPLQGICVCWASNVMHSLRKDMRPTLGSRWNPW